MKLIKKLVFGIVFTMLLFLTVGYSTDAYELVKLEKVGGGYVTYRNSSTVVEIPNVYELKGTEFRGAWVTPFVGDMSGFSNETAWRKEVAEVIEIFKHYNLNAMIFHVRTHNNALYKSKLNPVATWFSSANFDVFDPLEYLIEECHKAGIEFHAWMNPYRISTSTTDVNEASKTGQNLGAALPSTNIANDPSKLISGSSGVILNPGLPEVRNFIVDTCMEVIENYDVDAIHFDDYFYIKNADDASTRAKYNTKGLSTADWRREQVNLFIEQLHNAMTEYNQANNKAVQLGISPSGIYKNGNGSVSSGSNTAGFAHYGDYLYSDTYKWAKEGWIDYLLPQTYWAFEHSSAGYANVMDWWNEAFAGLDCLLYSGIGYYMSDSTGNASWSTNMNELTNQLKYLTKLPNASGYSLYSFKYMRSAYKGGTKNSALQVNNAEKAGCFSDVALLPQIDNFDPIILGEVGNLQVNGKTLTWTKNSDAKAYVIYRSTSELTYDESEIVDVIGGSSSTFTWTDYDLGTYNYDVCPLSRTNTVGGKAYEATVGKPSFTLETDTITSGTEVTANGGMVNGTSIQVGYTRYLYLGSEAPSDQRLQYTLTSSNPSVATISKWGTITAVSSGKTVIRAEYIADPSLWGEITIYVYEAGGGVYTVTFKDDDGTVLSTQTVLKGSSAEAPIMEDKYIGSTFYEFQGWDKGYTNVSSNLTVTAVYKKTTIEYILGDLNNNVTVETNDAIYLLYHVMLGSEKYPVNQPTDYNGDGTIDTNDAIYLLYHVMLGSDKYPLN